MSHFTLMSSFVLSYCVLIYLTLLLYPVSHGVLSPLTMNLSNFGITKVSLICLIQTKCVTCNLKNRKSVIFQIFKVWSPHFSVITEAHFQQTHLYRIFSIVHEKESK